MTQEQMEEVKKILDSVFAEGVNRMRPWSAGTEFPAVDFDDYVLKISQLFTPKPDESRLLSDEEQGRLLSEEDFSSVMEVIIDAIRAYSKMPSYWGYPPNTVKMTRGILEALKSTVTKQDAKTASIKDAECQARVEGIFEEIDKHSVAGTHAAVVASYDKNNTVFKERGWYSNLKKQEATND